MSRKEIATKWFSVSPPSCKWMPGAKRPYPKMTPPFLRSMKKKAEVEIAGIGSDMRLGFTIGLE